jgi:hypothetical protein
MTAEAPMIKSPDHVKHYNSAKHRFLKGLLMNFFARELPKLFGPTLRQKLADELVKLIAKAMPEKEHVKPGQLVWNAIDIKTRSDSPQRRFVPVILTIIDEEDCRKLTNGTKMTAIASNAIARICREAYQQGALLSMRDIGLMIWRDTGLISMRRKAYETSQQTTLPHIGSLQDMGSCVTHKAMIVRKAALEKKDPTQVAKETNHTLRAVENYLKDFHRVKTCYEANPDLDFISLATGIAKHVIGQYIKIIQDLKNA